MRTVYSIGGIISNDGGIQETITRNGGMYRGSSNWSTWVVQSAVFNSVGPIEFVLRRVRWPSCREELLLFLLRSFLLSSSTLEALPDMGLSHAVVCLFEAWIKGVSMGCRLEKRNGLPFWRLYYQDVAVSVVGHSVS